MYKTLLRGGIKKHKGILGGISVLIFLVSLALATVITVWTNSTNYLNAELQRSGFGTMTAWVSGLSDTTELSLAINALDPILSVDTQTLVYSNYTINGQASDSEGQLIEYNKNEDRYLFFEDNLTKHREESPEIAEGEVYVSTSLISMFDIQLGDNIDFSIARNGGNATLKVKGFYEDPFMGSAMIGMKGFLISTQDRISISGMINNSGIDALAREGAMIHIFGDSTSNISTAELNRYINQNTNLAQSAEFIYSAEAISGFMLILQNAFSALLLAFVFILMLVVIVALGHNITSNIETDYANMGILKALGYTSTKLRQIQLLQYGIAVLPSMLLSLTLVKPVSLFVSKATLTTTGFLVTTAPPYVICLAVFALLLAIICSFIILKTVKIKQIQPLIAIGQAETKNNNWTKGSTNLNGKYLNLSMAIRQVISGKKKYISATLIAIVLVFFASTIGRIDAWLGSDGKGMMTAFNPADHHIGVQMFGMHTLQDAQKITEDYTTITDSYQLAMVSAAVNGIDYSANIITDPKRFQILAGRTSIEDDEIVITEFVAKDLDVIIGDVVTVSGDQGSSDYVISGIYSCANNMGDNIGMSREAYLRIAKDNPQIWCDHYFLEDMSQRTAITQALTERFAGDVHVHENTWPGLTGIVVAMRILVNFMYGFAALFTLIIVIMTANKILGSEKSDMGIYKCLGFTGTQLRISFALRFGLIAFIGSTVGIVLSAIVSNELVSIIMKFAGISNFTSKPELISIVFPMIFVTSLFVGFAYLASIKIKQSNLSSLVAK